MMKILAAGLMLSAFAFAPLPAYAADAPAMMGDTSAGKAWVDAKGMALYTFEKDTATTSACNDDCAKEWPPLAAADDAQPMDEWTIVTRDDGTKMWAYDGHPLYTFVDDKKPGDVTGDGEDGFHLAK